MTEIQEGTHIRNVIIFLQVNPRHKFFISKNVSNKCFDKLNGKNASLILNIDAI